MDSNIFPPCLREACKYIRLYGPEHIVLSGRYSQIYMPRFRLLRCEEKVVQEFSLGVYIDI